MNQENPEEPISFRLAMSWIFIRFGLANLANYYLTISGCAFKVTFYEFGSSTVKESGLYVRLCTLS